MIPEYLANKTIQLLGVIVISQGSIRRALRDFYLFHRRIPEMAIVVDSKPILRFSLGRLMRREGRTLIIDLGDSQPVMLVKDDLIGIPSFQFTPTVLNVSAQDAIASIRWFDEITKGLGSRFVRRICIDHTLRVLTGGGTNLAPMAPFQVTSSLHILEREGVDVASKISEVKARIRGHLKAIQRARAPQAAILSEQLIRQTAELTTESDFARLAMEFGHRVKIMIRPDLLVDSIPTEVKTHHGTLGSRDLAWLINRGFLKQNAELLVIHCADLRWVDENVYDFGKALEKAIRTCKAGRKCVLLYYRNAWDKIPKGVVFVP